MKEPTPFGMFSSPARPVEAPKRRPGIEVPVIERHHGKFFFQQLSPTRMVATTLPVADAETMKANGFDAVDLESEKANGYFAEVTLPAGARRWRGEVFLRGALIFRALGSATPDSVVAMVHEAIARERQTHLAHLHDPHSGAPVAELADVAHSDTPVNTP